MMNKSLGCVLNIHIKSITRSFFSRRLERHLGGLIGNAPPFRFFQDRYRRGGPDTSDTQAHNMQKVIQRPHAPAALICTFSPDLSLISFRSLTLAPI